MSITKMKRCDGWMASAKDKKWAHW